MPRLYPLLLAFFIPSTVSAADTAPSAVPAATSADWAMAVQAAYDRGMKAAHDLSAIPPDTGNYTAWYVVGAMAVLPLAINIVKNVPGVASVVGMAADKLYTYLAPKHKQEAEKNLEVAKQGFEDIIAVIEACDTAHTIADLKKKIAAKVPSEVNDAIKIVKKSLKSGKSEGA